MAMRLASAPDVVRVLTRSLLVMAALGLVHAVSPAIAGGPEAKEAVAGTDGGGSGAQAKPVERAFTGRLPPNVVDMREQILAAVHAGDIGELKGAIEWNEIKPDFGEGAKGDPIAYLKTVSRDGEGREILAILANLLALPPARLALGKDPENSLVYVWPYLAELKPDELTPAEQVDLLRLVPPETAKAMRTAKKWTWWRIAIGADGTWHTFRKFE
jgi:hypothetical protein